MKEILLNMIKTQNETILKMQNLLNEWYIEANEADNRESVDQYYQKQMDTLNNISDLLYTNYYNTIHELFTNELIEEINKSIGYDFMSEKFINVIFK